MYALTNVQYQDKQSTLNMLHAFFWVIHRRLQSKCQRFGKVCLFHLHRWVGMNLPPYEDGTDSVPKRWNPNYKHRWITQKNACNFQNTAKVWNQELLTLLKDAKLQTHKQDCKSTKLSSSMCAKSYTKVYINHHHHKNHLKMFSSKSTKIKLGLYL
jgi:hypothetical protein